jgi:predicted ATP-dependent endonuclease of OLD family
MSYYKESDIDRKNRQWFKNNLTCNTLLKIGVNQSSIRGLGQFSMEFNYPITVIAGENGCGKSTILSLISCAFHNNNLSFCPMSLLSNTKKQRKYYTYSDFFAFTSEERGFLRDIQIKSTFLTDKSRNTDIRSKSPRKGQWKDYDTRPKKAVSFLGINRILPPSESLTYRNYSSYFGANQLTDEENTALARYMTRVFGKEYTGVSLRKLNKYRLYGCNRGANNYTGFNMGAGENAVLQLLHEIISAGNGALIVVDEIELGLHVRAQEQLMTVLKELCQLYCTQIICSSHSATIIGSVPPDGRILLRPKNGSIDILYGITPEMAMSELSGTLHAELSIFVEDEVAKDFILTILPSNIRRRINIMILGSADGSLLHGISTHLREGDRNFVVIMDGDKRKTKNQKIKTIVASLEDYHSMTSNEINRFLNKNIEFLPGNDWPEKVFLRELFASTDLNRLMDDCKVDSITEMKNDISLAITAGKHNEFYSLASELHLEERDVRNSVFRQYSTIASEKNKPILDVINQALN